MFYRYKSEENAETNDIDQSVRHLRVDCVGASKGLFLGILCLTASLLFMILFFIFVKKSEIRQTGLFLADTVHCSLLLASFFAIAFGVFR